MRRLALVLALLAANWSPAVRCLTTARAAAPSCHAGGASKSAPAPMSDCAFMACCQPVLLPAAAVAPDAGSAVPVLAAVAAVILVPPASPAESAPAFPPGPPGVLLAAARLARAPPAA